MRFASGFDSDRKRLMRYFRAFFLLLLGVAILFCCLQFFYTRHLVSQENENNSRNTFALLKHTHDVTFDQLLHSVAALVNDNNQYNSFPSYYQRNDVNQQRAALKNMDAIKNSVLGIENICFYYPEYDLTLSTIQTVSEFSLYHDYEFLSGLRNSTFPTFKTFVRSVSYPSSTVPANVVTLVISLPLTSTARNTKGYYLALDLKYSVFTSAFSEMIPDNESGLMIFNEQGTLLSGKGKTYPLSDLLDDTQFLNESIISLQKNVQGDEMTLYCTKNPDLNWIYIYAQDTSRFANRLFQIRNWIVIMFSGVVAVGILYAWFISKRLYRPIHQISEQLGNQEVDVFERIDGIIAQNEKLSNELQENLITGRNRRLLERMLLKFNMDNEEQGGLNLHPNEKECAFYLINTAMTRNSISAETLEEIFEQHGMRLVIQLYTAPNEIACIMASPGFTLDTILPPAQALLDSIRSAGGLINIGISRPFHDVSALSEAYRQAEEALGMHLVRGEGIVCCFWEIRNHVEPDYPFRIENAILRAFRDLDTDGLDKKLQEFQQYLLESDATAQVVRDFYVQIFCSCQRLVLDLPVQNGVSLPAFSHHDLINQPTLDDMNAYLTNMLHTFLAYKMPEPEKSEVIDRVCSYIDSNLNNTPTVEQLAAEFFLSPSGLRSEFNRVMGMSIKAYTDAQRLKLAKHLLENNNLRVLDIAARCGFNYAQSFITFFKSATTLTPGEYRQMVNKKRLEDTESND